MMDKLKPVRSAGLVLDYCRRCGGIWFDTGEVQQLRGVRPKGLPRAIDLRETAFRMPCHSCHVPMGRNDESCPSCGWKNRIYCPTCDRELERIERGELVLDACRRCQGVWFDNHELAQIWNMEVRRNLPTIQRPDGSIGVADYFMLDALLWAPDLMFLGVHSAAHGAAAVAGAVSNVSVDGIAGAAGGAFDAMGDVAGSVFEVIAEIIASVFS
jgi:Zn-finger nucleic acid-binding protein